MSRLLARHRSGRLSDKNRVLFLSLRPLRSLAGFLEAELAALKDEFKARGLSEVAGDDFTVTATDAVSWRLDTKAVRAFLGAKASKFETVSNTTTIRIKAANRLALAA